MERKCLFCDYTKHLDRCHIIPRRIVRFIEGWTKYESFDKRYTVLLCKNHHWEYDHATLSDDNFIKLFNDVILIDAEYADAYNTFICSVVYDPNPKIVRGKELENADIRKANVWILEQRKRLEGLGLKHSI